MCRIDVLKDTRERERERERVYSGRNKEKEKDETKQEKQVKKERGEIKMINCVDVKKVEKKEKKRKVYKIRNGWRGIKHKKTQIKIVARRWVGKLKNGPSWDYIYGRDIFFLQRVSTYGVRF